MPLALKITPVEQSKSSLYIYECTGKCPDNKGGYGKQNVQLSDVTEAYMELTAPDGTTSKVDVYPDMPMDVTDVAYELFPYNVGLTTFTSGKWKIKYVVAGKKNGKEFKYSTTAVVVLIKAAECCVDSMVGKTAKVSVNVLDVDDEKRKAVDLQLLLDNAKWAKECNNPDEADKILSFINAQCATC